MRGSTRFALAELLVVMVMVVVLAAILFPAFARAQDTDDQTHCLNNLKQMALAMHMYLGDSDGYFPIATWEYGKHPSPDPDIGTALLPILYNNYEGFRCPTDHIYRGPKSKYHKCSYGFGRIYGSDKTGLYGTRSVNDAGQESIQQSKNISDIKNPANYIAITEVSDSEILQHAIRFVVEGPGYNTHGCSDLGLVADDYPTNRQMAKPIAFRHGEFGNMAFADGHAKTVSSKLPCTVARGAAGECVELADMYTMVWDGP